MENNFYKYYSKLMEGQNYSIYFAVKNILYRASIKHLPENYIKIDVESPRNGGGKKFRMNLTKANKLELLEIAREVGTMETLENIMIEKGLNKGQACEYIEATSQGLEYKKDNKPFYTGGDVGSTQVKFQNASIVSFSTLERLAKKQGVNI